MKEQKNEDLISQRIAEKSGIKQIVYKNTYDTFQDVKKISKKIILDIRRKNSKKNHKIAIEYKDRGEFSSEMKIAGDLLIMTMHSNVFEFSKHHEIMKTSYVKEDPLRSYCGIIHIYNFLSDSFKYNRLDDVGYLIARIFINKEFHYFVEGKRQIGFLYNDFINKIIDKDAIKKIVESAILYCLDFDLLTPSYDDVKEVSVNEMTLNILNMKFKTGKRLGFKFQLDHEKKII